MIPTVAIKKAIEGGWRDQISRRAIDQYMEMTEAHAAVALDPTFWQALGKALGWNDKKELDGKYIWQRTAITFVNLILTGGYIEEFWADLLTAQKQPCEHICSGNCRREECKCECGPWHELSTPAK